jgi:hypothetical protein
VCVGPELRRCVHLPVLFAMLLSTIIKNFE